MSRNNLLGVVVTGEAIGYLIKSGTYNYSVISPVPATAEFCYSYYDPSRNAFICVFSDPSFPFHAEGALIQISTEPIEHFQRAVNKEQVSYGHFTGRVSEPKLESVNEWIVSLLKDGDTEEQLERQAALLGVIGTHLLANHPELVGEVATAISCAGDNHRIVDADEPVLLRFNEVFDADAEWYAHRNTDGFPVKRVDWNGFEQNE